MRNLGTIGDAWIWTDGADVWHGASGDHSGAELAGSRRPLTADEWARHVDPEPARRAATAAIDQRTAERIARGVVLPGPWSGKVLSASATSQANWLNLYLSRDVWPVPFLYPTLDDRDAVTVGSSAEIAAIYWAGQAHVAGHIRAGTAAKLAIAAATTRDEIDAIVTAYLEEP